MSNEMSVVAPAAPAASASLSATTTRGVPTTKMGKMIAEMIGGVPLGETETGSAWTLKALHPADSTVLTAPMPVNETRQFASVQFNQMEVESIPSTFNPALPWDMDLFVLRDPCLLYAFIKRQAGAATVYGYKFSTQYQSSGSFDLARVFLRSYCEKYRITSHSVTAYFDAASTSDQGHIVCGQVEYPRMSTGATAPGLTLDLQANLPYTFWQDPLPTYDNILQSTRSYQGPASMGCYAPSKLQNIGKWTSTNKCECLLGHADSSNPFYGLGDADDFAESAASAFYGTFPYMSLTGADGFKPVFKQTDTSMTAIFVRGCAATSQWRVTMRWTLDCFVRPGSVYAPFVRMPPVEDHLAQKMYAEVSRRMPDGFPGDHNFLGALLPVIGKLAASVLPTIVPAISSWLGGKAKEREDRYALGKFVKAPSFGETAAQAFMGAPKDVPQESLGAFQRMTEMLGPLWTAAKVKGMLPGRTKKGGGARRTVKGKRRLTGGGGGQEENPFAPFPSTKKRRNN